MYVRALLAALTLLLPGCPSDPMPDTGGVDVPIADVPMADVPGLDAGTDGGMPTTITICPGDALPSTGSACTTTAGSDSLLITADILAPGEVFRGGQALVDGTGHITCVGCDCSTAAGAAGATTVVCPDGVLSPGLVNAHEHLTFLGQPYTNTGERYEHRHDWRRGARGHTEIPSSGGASETAMAWAELRFVMGGATSINGSGGAGGFLRNLDRSGADMEGLGHSAVDYDTFPLGDGGGTLLTSGCAYPMINTTSAIAGLDSYTPHLSEGIDAAARNEFSCVSMGATDLIEPQTAFIHGVGLTISDIFTARDGGSMLIWSPRSNVTLYGDTARAPAYDRLGVPIALGTDWIFTGSMNMLRELQCADGLNADYFDSYFSDEDLWLMATYNGAVATGTEDSIGRIATGFVADLAIFDATVNVDHRAVIDATGTDVVLVLRGGRPLYGDAAVVAALPGGSACDEVEVCTEARRACVSAETGMSYSALAAANGSAYPLVECGTPRSEPSCHPERNAMGALPSPIVAGSTRYDGMRTATDGDGDGIADASDVCPTVFDPVRPMDGGRQPDFDGDGAGDACDPCPFDAGATCTLPSPDDRDADGVVDTMDNCVGVANADQADADGDMKGDACDACPAIANPGTAPCPATIYDIQDGTVAIGQAVAISNALVTELLANGMFVQVKMGDTGYAGADFSGVFVYTGGAPTAAVGNRVNVEGMVQDFFGETQLASTLVTVTSATVEAPPVPVSVTPAEIATGGVRADALEGVLVTVSGVSVTAVDAMFNEFTVDGALRVDDAAYLATPFPTVGQRFTSISGVLAYRNSNSKLLPRGAADLVGALLTMTPATAFSRVGDAGDPTFPEAVTVRLAMPAATDTFVAVVSSNPAVLAVMGGGVTVPAGMSSAPVAVDGLASGTVTLTATLAAEMATASVRVVDAAEVPSIVRITPASATVAPMGSQTFTVELDFPSVGGDVTVDLAVTPVGAGTLPATLTILDHTLSATFALTGITGDCTVTATLGASMASASVVVSAGTAGLMINEVDYDMVGTGDAEEFLELYNGGSSAVDLSTVAVVFVSGGGASMSEYDRVMLSGTLGAGEYLVITASTAVVGRVPSGVRTVAFDGTATANRIQNGPTDGVALLDVSDGTLIDALSYEGMLTAAVITGVTGTLDLVEGTALASSVADSNTMVASLCRLPNGTDGDDANTDWALSASPTPGAANVP